MTVRVYVQTDFGRMFGGVAIHIAQQIGDNSYLIGQPIEIEMAEPADPAIQHEPTLRLPDEVGRALLDALSAHYGGTTDVRSLRKDYDAERARVDHLIDHVIGRQR